MRTAVVVLSLALCVALATGESSLEGLDAITEGPEGVAAAPKAIVDSIIALFTDSTNKDHSEHNPWLHQAHAKQHGCVSARVTVKTGLDPRLAQGMFSTPGKQYNAMIRFSNGVGRGFTSLLKSNERDVIPDIRGLGMKVWGVEGTSSQSFTMTTAKVGFLPTPKDALEFFTAIHSGNAASAKYLLTHPRIALLYAKQATSGKVSNLLTCDWQAPVPQKHGPYTVKHRLVPCKPGSNFWGPGLSFNALRDKLRTALTPAHQVNGGSGGSSSGGGCFRWGIQFYKDDASTPVDDTTREWSSSQWYDVASVEIPLQPNVWDAAHEDACRFASMSPDLSSKAHAAVGATQDIRRGVYTAMAGLRHSIMGQPTKDITFEEWSALKGATSVFTPRSSFVEAAAEASYGLHRNPTAAQLKA
jgi:hypothetical protein